MSIIMKKSINSYATRVDSLERGKSKVKTLEFLSIHQFFFNWKCLFSCMNKEMIITNVDTSENISKLLLAIKYLLVSTTRVLCITFWSLKFNRPITNKLKPKLYGRVKKKLIWTNFEKYNWKLSIQCFQKIKFQYSSM